MRFLHNTTQYDDNLCNCSSKPSAQRPATPHLPAHGHEIVQLNDEVVVVMPAPGAGDAPPGPQQEIHDGAGGHRRPQAPPGRGQWWWTVCVRNATCFKVSVAPVMLLYRLNARRSHAPLRSQCAHNSQGGEVSWVQHILLFLLRTPSKDVARALHKDREIKKNESRKIIKTIIKKLTIPLTLCDETLDNTFSTENTQPGIKSDFPTFKSNWQSKTTSADF